VKRSTFDHVLVERAAELGAEVRFGPGGDKTHDWLAGADRRRRIHRALAGGGGRAQLDGRAAARLGAQPRGAIAFGLQAHLPAPAAFGNKVAMHLLAPGYCGVASVGGGEINLCLVARPARLPELKQWAAEAVRFSEDQVWRTITPLARAPLPRPAMGCSSWATPRGWSSHSPAKASITRWPPARWPRITSAR
jgi:hypothetical protein